ncbi:MAG: sensor histidine kinase [Candidatus Dormibacteria bacterium]
MFRSFTLRLALAFAGAGILTATVTAILVNVAFAGELSGYLTHQQDRERAQVATSVGDAYRRAGGWERVDLTAVSQVATMAGGSISVLDGSGRVVNRIDTQMSAGMTEMQKQMGGGGPLGQAHRDPVVVDGKTVGAVVTRLPEVGLAPVDAQFHQGVNGLFAIGGITGAVIAVLMGVFLASRATAPARALAKAARAVAAGDRSQRVPVSGDDEFAQMGQAFNAMAEAIDEEDRLRRNFAAAVAHEVRTPLSILRSEIEAIQDRLVRPSPRALASLHEEVVRLGRLISDLESLAYADAAAFSLDRQPTDLAELTRAALTEFAGPYAAEGLRLESELTSVSADVDPVRIRQAISNLLNNALKFSSGGSRVLVEVGPVADRAIVRVTDWGCGIAVDELPRVFDRFFRGRGARPGGSGIGLNVVQELVRAHGGETDISSVEGEGTTVTLQLPMLQSGSIPPIARHLRVASEGSRHALK